MTLAPVSRRKQERPRRFEGRWFQISGRALGHLFNEDAGFTLVETLAALTALTLVLIVLLAGLSQVARGGRDAETMRESLRLAQSKLDGLGVTDPLTPGESAGRFDNGFGWHLQIREVRKGDNVSLRGASAEITVSAPTHGVRVPHAVSLVTFKLAGARRR